MKRRDFVTALGIGAGAAALSACGKKEPEDCTQQGTGEQTASKEVIHWKMVTTWPKNFPGLGTAPERFAKNVAKMSNGRLQIKVHGAGELVPALEAFSAVSAGTAQIGHGAAYYWKGKEPAAQFFAAVPFGLNAQEMNSWIHYGGGQQLWDEAYEQFNLKPFAGGNTGVQMAGWFRKKINSLEDLKGLKMRIPGLGGEVLKKLGGVPVNIPGGELFTALQTGTIDATEWVGPYNDLAFGLYKAAKYYYYPGWHEPGTTLEVIVNKKALQELPEDLQAIVEQAIRASNQDMLDEYTARNNQALNTLVNEHKVELLKLPEDVLKQLHAVSNEVVQEVANTNEMTKKVYESFTKFAEQSRAYHMISEQAFYETRTL
ncbi:TRAP transporter substrate-binding protein [Spartinivicinus poritis]|uniref:TRAP transporter substrate-binding protein n=1 Tax=Spartinivicinus poritis TaxID=2994640 RepID=A0ABT5UFK2_9GAMM|nr:TRAP transporter substrate-binding protein [Spartinivicinus sp. A2-2]MDE1465154.1 TRAP transporter substrate-binding protein [Spartinivicinus sp. A2-2]